MKTRRGRAKAHQVVTLKMVADYLDISPGTVSMVLNSAPAASVIPQRTQKRIFSAARKLNYRPNFFAQSLRTRRSRMIAVIPRSFADPRAAAVIAGIEQSAQSQNYSLLVRVHGEGHDSIEDSIRFVRERGAEGVIAIDQNDLHLVQMPGVSIDTAAFQYQMLKNIQELLSGVGELAFETVLAHIAEGNGSPRFTAIQGDGLRAEVISRPASWDSDKLSATN